MGATDGALVISQTSCGIVACGLNGWLVTGRMLVLRESNAEHCGHSEVHYVICLCSYSTVLWYVESVTVLVKWLPTSS